MLGCIIQARMSSSRLPGKVMKILDGKNTSIAYTVSQIRYSKLIDKIVIATTDRKEDDVIVKFAKDNNIDFYRGSLEDVLDRHYQCAKKFSFQDIVRIPSDKPLVDPDIIDRTIKFYDSKSYNYVANYDAIKPYTQGTEVEIFSFQSLENAWKYAKDPSEREHVTPYIYNNNEKFKICRLVDEEKTCPLRWALDREEDLMLIREIISKIKKRPILKEDILELYKKEPKIFDINKNVVYNEGDLRTIEKNKEFLKNKRVKNEK